MTGKRVRRCLGLILVMVALLAVALFDSAPRIPESTPDVEAAQSARALFDRLRKAGSGFQPVSASAGEVSAAAMLAARAGNLARSRTQLTDGEIVTELSLPAPFGLWLNATGRISADPDGIPSISGRVGSLPVPPWLAGTGMGVARRWLSSDGRSVPDPRTLVRNLKIEPNLVTAEISLPPGGELTALAPARMVPIDGARVVKAYCQLASAQRERPTKRLSILLNRGFASDERSVEDNRATLVAVAMIAVSPEVARLAGPGVSAASRCGSAGTGFTLNGRSDLAKHWALSAALSAAFGPDASGIAGLWKELADSGEGGSGFSYVDLAADRSGALAGDRASSEGANLETAEWLAGVNDAQLLPVSQLALAEGMSEADFTRRYGNIDSARHKHTVASIDRTLSKTLPR